MTVDMQQESASQQAAGYTDLNLSCVICVGNINISGSIAQWWHLK